MPEEILTVPQPVNVYRPLLVSGNEYLTFPEIEPRDGGLYSINLLHMGAKGLIEFCGPVGKPLIYPYLKIDDESVNLRKKMVWSYRHAWIPVFYCHVSQMVLQEIFVPPGHRGAVYLLGLENRGRAPLQLEVGFKINWGAVKYSVFKSRKIEGRHSIYQDDWTGSLVLVAAAGTPLASLAFAMEGLRWMIDKRQAGEIGRASAGDKILLAPGQKISLPLYMAVNIEGSGAGTTIVDFRRLIFIRRQGNGCRAAHCA